MDIYTTGASADVRSRRDRHCVTISKSLDAGKCKLLRSNAKTQYSVSYRKFKSA